MKSLFITFIMAVAAHSIFAQSATLKGLITDEKGQPIKGIAISLLQPEDSTLAFFGISNAQGYFEIVNASNGSYVLQAAGIGHRAYYAKLGLPIAGGNTLAPITLHTVENELDSVKVSAQKIPILFKGDTVEYNASSFKTKPDAVVEELLKKMPGVEVDKDGNIKAHGKEVQKVTVDGKEFFGNDPKVATKNLPADAIDKVQVFDGLSDVAQFTGVDDGAREKTINLQMKSSKRKGYFGDIEAGAGSDERYKASAKIYRFQKKSQFAALGMLNNINQFGFTLQDYMTFKGGIQGLMDGGGLQLDGRSPVNFGRQSPGLITSGAAGFNYTFEPKAGRRYNVSYLGDGVDKKLDQQTDSRNFTGSETFTRAENSDERNKDYGHRLYASIRHDFDSTSQVRLNLNAAYASSNTTRQLLSSSAVRDIVLNKLDSHIEDVSNGLNGDATLGWTKRLKGGWPVLKLSATGGIDDALSKTNWNNITTYTATSLTTDDNQYQHNDKLKYRYSGGGSITRNLNNNNFLDIEARGGYDYDRLNRDQGLAGHEASPTDSLSLHFRRQYLWARPGLTFKHSTRKLQYNIALRAEEGWLQSETANAAMADRAWSYILPSGFVQYMPDKSVSANAEYSSAVTAPSARQMIPTTDYSNSIQRVHGNPLLMPENKHTLYLNWRKFDQFSFTSINASVQGTYTKDKINFNRRINSDLGEDIFYTNVPSDYNVSARGSYSTPIRRLGVNVNFSLSEQYTRGLNSVNDVMNINSSFTHSGKLGISNRKQDKWSVEVAISSDITDSRYSVQQSLNSTFVHYNGFAELTYKPSTRFYFSITADADRYTSRSFDDAVFVPLLKASAAYYFLKGNRGVITVDGFDLLNQNKNIQRISQLNYLLEQRSNTIGRYFMMSFKYRLSHAGNDGGPRVDIKLDH